MLPAFSHNWPCGSPQKLLSCSLNTVLRSYHHCVFLQCHQLGLLPLCDSPAGLCPGSCASAAGLNDCYTGAGMSSLVFPQVTAPRWEIRVWGSEPVTVLHMPHVICQSQGPPPPRLCWIFVLSPESPSCVFWWIKLLLPAVMWGINWPESQLRL